MKPVSRRLVLVAPFLASPLLASCGGQPVDASRAIADAQIVVDGVAAVYQSILTLYPNKISAAQASSVAGYLASARTALTQLSASSDALSRANSLQGVEDAVNAVLVVVAGIPGLPPQITAGVTAATVLLPLIEATVNALRNAPPKLTASAPPAMLPEQARLTLRSLSAK